MTVNLSYKHFIATFLLGLYVFIAAPVQLWHHHPVSAIKKTVAASQQDVVSSNISSLSDADCSICSHKYSTWSGITLVHFTLPPIVIPANYGNYHTRFISSPVSTRTNKGPPVFS